MSFGKFFEKSNRSIQKREWREIIRCHFRAIKKANHGGTSRCWLGMREEEGEKKMGRNGRKERKDIKRGNEKKQFDAIFGPLKRPIMVLKTRRGKMYYFYLCFFSLEKGKGNFHARSSFLTIHHFNWGHYATCHSSCGPHDGFCPFFNIVKQKYQSN